MKVAEETIVTVTAGDDEPLATKKGNLEEMKINITIPESEFLPPIPFTHRGKRAALSGKTNTQKAKDKK